MSKVAIILAVLVATPAVLAAQGLDGLPRDPARP
jgi:hypothetical protein